MTANQYKAALKALGLSQQGAADFLGVSLRTSAGWAAGDWPVPTAASKLLRLMLRLKLMPDDVE